MPFAYYSRLSKKEQAAYRKSDAKTKVDLPDAKSLRELAAVIEPALADDEQKRVQRATKAFVDAFVAQLKAPPVTTRVLAVRPHDESEELHGLYVLEEDGTARLRVWMRTAAQRRPVAFRTFVRTVLHELCHHLDFTVFDLDPSFHTEGFFKRESHLARQILGPRQTAAAPPKGQLRLL
jgi:hypothetical protein